jgi:sugar phosphate isomerase/epimerase
VTEPAHRIGVQLYSVRDRLDDHADATVDALAAIGFEGVETAFRDPDTDLEAWSTRLTRADLRVAAVHVPLPVTGEMQDFVRRHVAVFGADVAIFPGNREEPRAATDAGLREIATEFTVAAAFAASLGIRFGIHHHWWELRRLDDGRLAIEHVFDLLPDDVLLQPDGYWCALAGVDIRELARSFAGRMPVQHIKDGPAADTVAPMTALGRGRVDLDAALALAAEAPWWIAELSHSGGDTLEDLRTSFHYLDERRRR